jgi:hypothetical protein
MDLFDSFCDVEHTLSRWRRTTGLPRRIWAGTTAATAASTMEQRAGPSKTNTTRTSSPSATAATCHPWDGKTQTARDVDYQAATSSIPILHCAPRLTSGARQSAPVHPRRAGGGRPSPGLTKQQRKDARAQTERSHQTHEDVVRDAEANVLPESTVAVDTGNGRRWPDAERYRGGRERQHRSGCRTLFTVTALGRCEPAAAATASAGGGGKLEWRDHLAPV